MLRPSDLLCDSTRLTLFTARPMTVKSMRSAAPTLAMSSQMRVSKTAAGRFRGRRLTAASLRFQQMSWRLVRILRLGWIGASDTAPMDMIVGRDLTDGAWLPRAHGSCDHNGGGANIASPIRTGRTVVRCPTAPARRRSGGRDCTGRNVVSPPSRAVAHSSRQASVGGRRARCRAPAPP